MYSEQNTLFRTSPKCAVTRGLCRYMGGGLHTQAGHVLVDTERIGDFHSKVSGGDLRKWLVQVTVNYDRVLNVHPGPRHVPAGPGSVLSARDSES